MKTCKLAACLMVVLLLPAPARAEGDGKVTLETGLDFNTGRYGGTQSTDIYYMPFSAKYQGSAWTLKLTVPYLQVTGPANVINLINGTVAAPGPADRTTRAGWGDVLASAGRMVYNGGPDGLIVNLTGKVKFGTASAAQGLGTGKNDYALQSEIYEVSGAFTTFGSVGYRVNGSPPGFVLRNTFYGTLGESYKFSSDVSGGVMLNLGQRVVDGGANRAEALAFLTQKLDREWKLQGYMLLGFTTSVPDVGAGATLGYAF